MKLLRLRKAPREQGHAAVLLLIVLVVALFFWLAPGRLHQDSLQPGTQQDESDHSPESADLRGIEEGHGRIAEGTEAPVIAPSDVLQGKSGGKPFWESEASIHITLIPGPGDVAGIPPFVAMLFDTATDQDWPEPVVTSSLSQGNEVQVSCMGGSYVVGIMFPGSPLFQPRRGDGILPLFVDGQSSTHMELEMPALVTRRMALNSFATKDSVPGYEFEAALAPVGLPGWVFQTDSEGLFQYLALSDEYSEGPGAEYDTSPRWVQMPTLLRSTRTSTVKGFGLWDEGRGAAWFGSSGFLADVLLGPLAAEPGRVSVEPFLLRRTHKGARGYQWLGDSSWTSALRCSSSDSYRIQTTFSEGGYSELWAEVVLFEQGANIDLGNELQVVPVPSQVEEGAWDRASAWRELELSWSCKRQSFAPRTFGATVNWSPGEVLHLLSDGAKSLNGVLSVVPQIRPGRVLIGGIKVTTNRASDPLFVRMRHFEIRCVDAAGNPVPHAGIAFTLMGRNEITHALADDEGLLRISLFGETAMFLAPIGVQSPSLAPPGVRSPKVVYLGPKSKGLPPVESTLLDEIIPTELVPNSGRRTLFVPGIPTRVRVRVESERSLQGHYVRIVCVASEPLPGQNLPIDPDYPVETGVLDSASRTEFHGLPEGRYRIDVFDSMGRSVLNWDPFTYVEVSRKAPKPTVLITLKG